MDNTTETNNDIKAKKKKKESSFFLFNAQVIFTFHFPIYDRGQNKIQ